MRTLWIEGSPKGEQSLSSAMAAAYLDAAPEVFRAQHLQLLLFALTAHAASAPAGAMPELKLLHEYPVDGMPSGNLSGLAHCGGEWLTLSDHDDDRFYRLQAESTEIGRAHV